MQKMQQRRRDPAAFEVQINQRRNLEAAERAAKAGNLPEGWGSAVDPASGDTYYFDKETKATQVRGVSSFHLQRHLHLRLHFRLHPNLHCHPHLQPSPAPSRYFLLHLHLHRTVGAANC